MSVHRVLQPYTNFSRSAHWRSRRVYLLGALGTVIEWYDFALYVCFAHVFATIFFANQTNAILMVYLVFFFSYLARLLGGLFFGLIGDAFGRKPALLSCIFMITLCMFAMAALPTQKTLGGSAPMLLVIFRVVQGFSVGGETARSLVYVLESVDNRHQGFYGATIVLMIYIGWLLATVAVVLSLHFLSHTQLLTWGWRLAYALGGVAGFTIFMLRMIIPESLEFYTEQQRLINQKISKLDRRFLVREVLAQHKLSLIRVVTVLAFSCAVGGFVMDYYPVYLHQYFAIHLVIGWTLHIFTNLLIMSCTILSGVLSDRLGRVRLPLIDSGSFLFFSYPLLNWLSSGQWHIAAVVMVLSNITLAVYEGPLPALLVRLAPSGCAVRFLHWVIISLLRCLSVHHRWFVPRYREFHQPRRPFISCC